MKLRTMLWWEGDAVAIVSCGGSVPHLDSSESDNSPEVILYRTRWKKTVFRGHSVAKYARRIVIGAGFAGMGQ